MQSFQKMFGQFRSTFGKIALVIGFGVCAYVVYRKLKSKGRSQMWVQVGTISEIFVYPIKSCKGHSVMEAECEIWGLKSGDYYDRRFIFADSDGKFITARKEPRLVLIESQLDNDNLILSAPGMEPIKINLKDVVEIGKMAKVRLWSDVPIDAYDCGSDISLWTSDFLGRSADRKQYHLFYRSQELLIRDFQLSNLDKLAGVDSNSKHLAIFFDLSPYMLMTEASLSDLNRRTPNGEQFPIRNFRPNFLVTGKKPYDEDNWAQIRIGEGTAFKLIQKCGRCVFTTVNWLTGEKHESMEPLRTLRSYRLAKDPKEKKEFGDSPMFGINLASSKTGMVRVGDPVFVIYK